MKTFVGLDVAKDPHWASAINQDAGPLFSPSVAIADIGDIRRFRSADALAAAAGLTPVLRQSGKSHAIRRANGGDKALKRVFYQSSFVALATPESKACYDRKSAEGKRHNQAVTALARRRINVVWALPTTRPPYLENFKVAA
ncbi:MAG: transposase [Roseicyclus sp.]